MGTPYSTTLLSYLRRCPQALRTRELQGVSEFQPTSFQLSKPELIWFGSSHHLYHCSGTNEGVGLRPSTSDFDLGLCPRSGSPRQQWDDAGEARQLHLGRLLLPTSTTANRPLISCYGRCSCSGTGTRTPL